MSRRMVLTLLAIAMGLIFYGVATASTPSLVAAAAVAAVALIGSPPPHDDESDPWI